MILERTSSIGEFGTALSKIAPLVADLCVILIMSRRETAQMRDEYVGFSRAASLYDTAEVEGFISAFRAAGVHVEHFEDELQFINWHQRGGYSDVPRRHKFVYSFAINGTGPARRSLIPAYCSQERIPTVNSDAYTCAVGRHKFHVNRLLDSVGIAVPRSWLYDSGQGWFRDAKPPAGTHVIGKATYEDGSIGITPATVGPFSAKLESAFGELSAALRQPVTVQEFVFGDEIEVPVIELAELHAPLPVMMLAANGEGFSDRVVSYTDAWNDQYQFVSASRLAHHTVTAATSTAIEVSRMLGHRGFARIDFRVADDGLPLVIDIAAHPHLSRSSSYAWLFEKIGFSYEQMLLILIATAARRIGVI